MGIFTEELELGFSGNSGKLVRLEVLLKVEGEGRVEYEAMIFLGDAGANPANDSRRAKRTQRIDLILDKWRSLVGEIKKGDKRV